MSISIGDIGAVTGLTGGMTLPLVGPALGYAGVSKTNEANQNIASARNAMEVAEAAKAREFSADEAQKNREFQMRTILKKMGFDERMSSSAVQRRYEDMKKAGINPILAGKFDASTPAGAVGSGAQPTTAKANAHGYIAQNKIQAGLEQTSTALDMFRKVTEIKNIQANTKSTLATAGIKQPWSDISQSIGEFTTFLRRWIQTGNSGWTSHWMGKAFEEMLAKPTKPPPSAGNPFDKPLLGYQGKRNLFSWDPTPRGKK